MRYGLCRALWLLPGQTPAQEARWPDVGKTLNVSPQLGDEYLCRAAINARDRDQVLPENPGRLHGHVRDPFGRQPVGQLRRECVIVEKVRTCLVTFPVGLTIRTQATTLALWTSRPAQRGNKASIRSSNG